MAVTRYAGDRFTIGAGEVKPTGVLDGGYLIDTGNLTQFVKRTVGGTSQWTALAGGGGGGGSPGGSNTQVQYNNAGVFGGNANLTFDGSKLSVNTIAMSGIIYDSNNSVGNGGMVLTNEGTTGVNWKNIESVLSGVGGSGVANYVARWSDEDTLTSGVLYDNGTKVGIGTTDPEEILHLESAGAVTPGLLHDLYSTTDSRFPYLGLRKSASNTAGTLGATADGVILGKIVFKGVDSGPSYFRESASIAALGDGAPDADTQPGKLYFSTSDTSSNQVRMTIKNDGNVGIGTTTPGGKLESYITSGGEKGLRLNSNFAGGNTVDFIPAIVGVSNAGFSIDLAGTNRLVINSGGNVGIGTNSPSHRLHVLGATTGGWNGLNLNVVISSSNTYANGHAGGIAFGGAYNSSETQTVLAGVWASRPNAGDGQYAGMVHIGGREHNTSNIAQVLTVTHANVGIGTVAPVTKFEVRVDSSDGSASTHGAHIGTANNGLNIGANDGGNYAWIQTKSNDNLSINPYGAKVGIGTTGPDDQLHIVGNNGDQLKLDNDGDAWTQLNFANNDTNKTFLALDHANHYFVLGAQNAYSDLKYISFRPDGVNDYMVIERDGNVGIGTTDPAYRLEVKASITGGWLSRIYNTATTGNHSGLLVRIDNPSSTGIILGANANGAYRFVVKPNGNVGIGTNTPAALLQLLSDGAHDEGAEIFLKHANNNTTDIVGTILFGNNVGGVAMIQGGTTGANNTGYISFSTDNAGTSSEKVRIIGDGNVGIGTTNPAVPLHITKSAVGDNEIPEVIRLSTLNSASPSWSTTDGLCIGAEMKKANGTTITKQPIRFRYDGGDMATTFEAGNVGIGTDQPLNLLMINGSSPIIRFRDSDASGTPLAYIDASDGALKLQADASDETASSFLTLEVDGSEHVRVVADGNVGIGTTTPAGRLHASDVADFYVDVDGTDSAVVFKEGGGNSWRIGNRANGDKFNITQSATSLGSNVRLTIDNGGNVGIGDNLVDPEHRLHVSGDAIISGYLYDSTNSTGVDGYVLTSKEDGPQWKMIEEVLSGVGGNGTANYVPKWVDSDTLGNSVIYDDGDIGIGTSDPQAKLHIDGGLIVSGDANTGMDIVGESNYYTRIIGNDETHPTQSLAGGRIIAPESRRLYFELQGNDVTDHFRFLTSPNNDKAADYVAMHIGNNGSVGIGTNAPNSKVDVLVGSRSTAFAPSNGATWHDLIVRNPNNTQNAAVGLAFELHGTYHVNAAAGIAAVKEVGSSDYGAGLAFVTRPQSAVAEERARITADGNVGIGTTNPTLPLHVYRASGNVYAKVQNASTSQAALQLQTATSNGNWVMYIPTNSSNLRFYRGADKVTLTADGSVGIGTTDPAKLLTVESTSSPIIGIYSTYADAAARNWAISTNNAAYGDFTISNSAANGGNPNAIKLSILKDGNVGIGTAGPDNFVHIQESALSGRGASNSNTSLTIEQATDTGIQFFSATQTQIRFGDAASTAAGAIIYEHGDDNFKLNFTDHLTINDGGAEIVRVTSDERVGIGTTDPQYLLEVYGDATLNSSGATTDVTLRWEAAGATKWRIKNDTAVAGGTAHTLTFTSAGAANVSINQAGNVGIGTNAPEAALTVAHLNAHQAIFRTAQTTASERAGGGFSSSGNATAASRYARLFLDADGANFSGTDYFTIEKFGNSGEVKLLQYSNANMSFWVNTTTQAMTIKNDGNVGIGTTAPVTIFHSSKRDLSDDTVTEVARIEGVKTGTAYNSSLVISSSFAGSTVANRFIDLSVFDHNPTSRSLILQRAGGNIGLGVTDPDAKLEIKGTAASTGLTFKTTDSSSNNTFWVMDGGKVGLHYYPFVINQDSSDSNCPAATFFYVHHASAPFTIKNDGKVGVGTTNPSELLHVRSTSGAAAIFERSDAASVGIRILGSGMTTSTCPKIHAEAGPDLAFTVNNAERMRILGTGNVGIGTTAPNFAAAAGNTVKGLNIQNVGQDTQASLRLTGHNASGSPGVATYTELLHAGANLRFDINHNGTVRFSIGSGGAITFNSAYTFPTAIGSAGQVLKVPSSGTVLEWSTETGPVSGSGTTNYVSKWTGGSALGNSSIFDDGDVGIGTDDPAVKLDVYGSLNLRSEYNLTWGGTAGADIPLIYGKSGSSGYLAFHSQGTDGESMRIDAAGNVGIGTTAPDQLLHLNKASGETIAKTEVAANSTVGFEIKKTGSTTQNWRIVDGQTVNGVLEFYDVTNTATRISIKGDGNVGIGGVTNATGLLQIGNNYTIPGSSYGGNDIYIASTGSHASYDPYVTNTDDFRALITISDSGTTGPTKPGLILYNDDTTAGGFSPMLLFAKREAGSSPYKAATAAIYTRSPLGTGDSDSWIDGELIFATAGAATNGIRQRMVINKEGLVGIGTTTPGAKLHVRGSDGYLKFDTSGSDGTIKSDYNLKLYADDTGDNSSGYQNIQFYTAGANERMRISHDGKVAIGTIVNTYKFEVVTGASAGVFEYDTVANGTQTIKFEPSSTKAGGTSKIYSSYAGTGATEGKLALGTYSAQTAVVMTSTGSVGIGTTDPAYNLQVYGYTASAYDDARLALTAGNLGDSELLLGDTSAADHGKISYYNRASAHADESTMTFTTNGSEQVRINKDGKVGIGTTDPGSELHIASSDNRPTIRLEGNKTTDGNFADIYATNDGTNGEGQISFRRAGNNDAVDMLFYTSATSSAIAERMRITSDGVVDIVSSKMKIGGSAGTDGYVLTTDGAGGIAWEASPGDGSVDGSGTAGKVTKWSDSDTVTDSSFLSESGTTLTNTATLTNFSTNNATVTLSTYGRLGVGTNSATSPFISYLADNSTWSGDHALIRAYNGGNRGAKGHASGSNLLKLDFSDACAMIVNKDGNVGIGTTAPSHTLHVYSDDPQFLIQDSGNTNKVLEIRHNNGNSDFVSRDNASRGSFRWYGEAGTTETLNATLDADGNLSIAGTLTESSSLAIKENIENFTPNLDVINKIRPVKYNKKRGKKKEIGLIAEELAELFPELVEKDEKGNPSSVNYSRAVTVLLGGFKELYKEVQELKKRI